MTSCEVSGCAVSSGWVCGKSAANVTSRYSGKSGWEVSLACYASKL